MLCHLDSYLSTPQFYRTDQFLEPFILYLFGSEVQQWEKKYVKQKLHLLDSNVNVLCYKMASASKCSELHSVYLTQIIHAH